MDILDEPKTDLYKIDREHEDLYNWCKNPTDEVIGMTCWRYYHWTKPVKQLYTRFITPPNLIFLEGIQGIGKTSALRAIYEEMRLKKHDVYMVKWGNGYNFSEFKKIGIESKYLLIDLPDYSYNNKRKMTKDLDAIQSLWEREGHTKSIIVTLQKELAQGHYFTGKGTHITLEPLKPEEIINTYRQMYQIFNPFTPEALKLLAQYSNGIFRQFQQYLMLCIEEAIINNTQTYDKNLVETTITPQILEQNMQRELSILFTKQAQRRLAYKIIHHLRTHGPQNQKQVADHLNTSQSTITRIINTLEDTYIKRTTGKGNEKILTLP